MRTRSIVTIIIIVIVLLLVASATLGLAAYRGWVSIPAVKNVVERAMEYIPGQKEPPTFIEVLQRSQGMESAKITTALSLAIEAKEAATKDLPSDDDTVLENVSGRIPKDMTLSGSITSYWQESDSDSMDNETVVLGQYTSSGLTVEADAALKRIDETNYIQINKLPTSALYSLMEGADLSSIYGSWIMINSDDITDIYDLGSDYSDVFKKSSNSESSTVEIEKALSQYFEEVKILLQAGAVNGAWSLELIDDNVEMNDKKYFKVKLVTDYTKVEEAFKIIYEGKDSLLTDIEEPRLFTANNYRDIHEDVGTLQEIGDYTDIYMWVCKQTGYPGKIEFDFKAGLEKQLVQDEVKQVHVAVSVDFEDINEKIDIEKPETYIEAKELIMLISGMTEEQVEFQQQTSNIEDLRTALKYYHEANSEYPSTLEELVGLEIRSNREVVNIPKDIYSEQDFVYEKSENDYSFKYSIVFPEDVSETYLSLYVEGENTTNSEKLSIEVEAQSTDPNLDSDEDGLSNAREAELGTDPNKKDTDGDGFNDKQEVDGGFDPLESAASENNDDGDDSDDPLIITAPNKAYDTKRLADLKSMQSALELYSAENGNVPYSLETWQDLEDELIDYLVALPEPPNNKYSYTYGTNSDGSKYCLLTSLSYDNQALDQSKDEHRCGIKEKNWQAVSSDAQQIYCNPAEPYYNYCLGN